MSEVSKAKRTPGRHASNEDGSCGKLLDLLFCNSFRIVEWNKKLVEHNRYFCASKLFFGVLLDFLFHNRSKRSIWTTASKSWFRITTKLCGNSRLRRIPVSLILFSLVINSSKSYCTFYTVCIVSDLIKVPLHLLQILCFLRTPEDLIATSIGVTSNLEHPIACPHIARANFNL